MSFFLCSITPTPLTRIYSDVIIVEDDPYYFLQVGEYILPKDRRHSKPSSDTTSIAAYEKGGSEEQAFLDSLAPSYLRLGPRSIWVKCIH